MIVIGLTGSIGMGKSTVGAMLEELGVAVHDSDAAVHDSLKPGQDGYIAVARSFPYFEFPDIYAKKNDDGQREINRQALGQLIFKDEEKRKTLESVLHPIVQLRQQEFIKMKARMGKDIVALDIPLLFETGAENRVDFTIVVSAPYNVQRERVLSRPGMTEEKFERILAAQMSDAEKCARADFIVKTGLNKAETMKSLKRVLKQIKDQA